MKVIWLRDYIAHSFSVRKERNRNLIYIYIYDLDNDQIESDFGLPQSPPNTEPAERVAKV